MRSPGDGCWLAQVGGPKKLSEDQLVSFRRRCAKKRHRRWTGWLLACWLGSLASVVSVLWFGLGPLASVHAQSTPAANGWQLRDLPPDSAEAFRRLTAPGVGFGDRFSAAARLLQQDPAVAVRPLAAALGADQSPEVWRAVFLALAGHPGPLEEALLAPLWERVEQAGRDAGLLDAWSQAVGRFGSRRLIGEAAAVAASSQQPMDIRMAAIRALGHMRERESAAVLMGLTGTAEPEDIQRAAYAALADLSGIRSYHNDQQAWTLWHEMARRLNEARWQRHLLENFIRGQVDRQTDLLQLEARLVESQRALYRATSAADRPGVLAYMLADPLVPIRELGMELSVQRLLDGQSFDEPLRQALRTRLIDPAPRIRELAALLLRDLADDPAADLVADRLATGREQVADVQAAYLKMLARLPREGVVEPAYALLEVPALRGWAAGALAAAFDAGMLDRRSRDRVLRRVQRYLRNDEAARVSPPPQIVRLLGRVGSMDDWALIAGWVDHADSAIKQAAAEAWAESDRSLNLLAQRAGDPVIRPIVIVAATQRGSDPWTLQSLAKHRPTLLQEIEAWERALVAVAGRVQPEAVLPTVLELVEVPDTAILREQMMSASLAQAQAREDPDAPYLELLLERAEIRRQLERHTDALADYDRLAVYREKLSDASRERLDRGRVHAYLTLHQIERSFQVASDLLGRVGEAGMTRATDDPIVDLFIETAQRQVEQGRPDQARKILSGTRSLLGVHIKPEVAQRIRLVEARLPAELVPAPAVPTP